MNLAELLAKPLTEEEMAEATRVAQEGFDKALANNWGTGPYVKASEALRSGKVFTVGDAISDLLGISYRYCTFLNDTATLGGMPFEALEKGKRLREDDCDQAIYLFRLDGRLFAGYGYYTSMGGFEFDGSLKDFREVKPVTKTYVSYESI